MFPPSEIDLPSSFDEMDKASCIQFTSRTWTFLEDVGVDDI